MIKKCKTSGNAKNKISLLYVYLVLSVYIGLTTVFTNYVLFLCLFTEFSH